MKRLWLTTLKPYSKLQENEVVTATVREESNLVYLASSHIGTLSENGLVVNDNLFGVLLALSTLEYHSSLVTIKHLCSAKNKMTDEIREAMVYSAYENYYAGHLCPIKTLNKQGEYTHIKYSKNIPCKVVAKYL